MPNIELLPKQHEFLISDAEECGLVSGIGFGKTTVGSLFVINETALNPNKPGLIVANTYSQLRSATLLNLQQWCDKLGIFYNYNSSTKIVTINSTNHFVRSAESFQASRGLEAAFLWADETAYIPEEALDVFLGRIRYNGGSLKKRYTTSPAGLNHFYHRMHKDGDNYHPSRHLIKAKTEDNYFLPKGYVESLRRSYSSKMAAQELDADFVSMSGMCCYNDFDRKKHLKQCKHLFTNSHSQQLYIFCDYNIDPFVAVVGFKDGGIIYIIDEIFLEGGSDTRMMATEIKKRYGGCNPIVVGDGTGNNKRSIINIRQTSYTIFKEEGLRTENFTNPHVVKRISNLNRCLFNNVLIIDPICKHLIRDLELVVYAKNSNEIDKNMDKTLTHISDALSYMCFKLDPPKDYNQKSTSYAI